MRKISRTRKHRASKKSYRKNKITAFVPKTLKTTENLGKNVVNSGYSFFRTLKKTTSRLSSSIDRQTAKAIRSLTKRR